MPLCAALVFQNKGREQAMLTGSMMPNRHDVESTAELI